MNKLKTFSSLLLAALISLSASAYEPNRSGMTVTERYPAPEGFKQTRADEGSFAHYLANHPLYPADHICTRYDGSPKYGKPETAVLNVDFIGGNLQQCADAIIRLRAEYLYSTGQYDKIHFNLTNGMRVDYVKWAKGMRVSVNGNKTAWYDSGHGEDYGLHTFRKYLSFIFSYAGTLSLSRELKKVPFNEAKVGDIFIEGGSPGHAVIIVNMATDHDGRKAFMVAQSYMPAQEIEILNNDGNPWHILNPNSHAYFGWPFDMSQIMGFE